MDTEPKLHCGILGATGSVGQRLVQLLENHPWFQVTTLGASERSAGKAYSECVHWVQASPLPNQFASVVIKNCVPEQFSGCRLVFSALDASVAGPIEEAFAKAGIAVFSNAKNHRTSLDVPILLPLVNPDHLDIVTHQRKARGYDKGFIVTNANCSSTGLVVVLKPLKEKFGLTRVNVVTLQAISGAGYPGVATYDILGNVVPFISGEEDKMASEPQKMLGVINENQFQLADFKVSAQCNRVPVLDGHTLCVNLELPGNPSIEEVTEALNSFVSPVKDLNLPSAPASPIRLTTQPDHPQPRIDLGEGFMTVVGRIRPCELFTTKMVILTHNTIIGAAGGAILNAELAKAKGYL